MNTSIKVCRDCAHRQSDQQDLFRGHRCMSCFKNKDNARGRMKRYLCRNAKGAIKPSSELTTLRECSGCRKTKVTLDDFYFHTTVRGETIPDRQCKECKGNWFSEYRKRNRVKYAAYQKAQRERNPEKMELQRRKHRTSPKAKETARRYSADNREKSRIRAREYARTERGRIATINKRQRERAKRLSAITERSALVTDSWVGSMFSLYDNRCVYCLETCLPTMDHVVPVSRGGKHEQENIVPACHPCNSSKRDRLVDEWKPWVVIPTYGLGLSTA